MGVRKGAGSFLVAWGGNLKQPGEQCWPGCFIAGASLLPFCSKDEVMRALFLTQRGYYRCGSGLGKSGTTYQYYSQLVQRFDLFLGETGCCCNIFNR